MADQNVTPAPASDLHTIEQWAQLRRVHPAQVAHMVSHAKTEGPSLPEIATVEQFDKALAAALNARI